MRRYVPVLLIGLCLVSTFVMQGSRSGAQHGSAGLPGARPEIDAAQFATLQAALDALPEGGGVVRLPAGEFEISQPLVLASEDVLLLGAGTSTHIKNVNTEGQPALVIAPKTFEENRGARIWRIKLEDFRITGNEKSGDGIVARGVNEIFLEGLTVSYHGGHGIVLDHCYEDPRICDSLITYNKATGLELLGCHDIVVASNQFEENNDALRCLDGFNLCMTGNCLDDHLQHGVIIENTYGSVVSGNMIEECKGTAVILDRDCYGITVSANVIAHNFGGGVDLRDAHGCAVSANTFTIVPTAAVTVGPNSARITISANNFSDSYIGEGKERRKVNDQAASGIVLNGTRDVAVSGNVFSGLSSKALELPAPASRVALDGNVFAEVETGGQGLVDSQVSDNIEP